MKAFTDLEQSKKLAEILPIESADMYWWSSGKRYYIEAMDDGDFNEGEGHIRAWSLAALLDVLPKNLNIGRPALDSNYMGYYWIQYYDEFMKPNNYKTECFNNPIDACVEMIVLLKENGNI